MKTDRMGSHVLKRNDHSVMNLRPDGRTQQTYFVYRTTSMLPKWTHEWRSHGGRCRWAQHHGLAMADLATAAVNIQLASNRDKQSASFLSAILKETIHTLGVPGHPSKHAAAGAPPTRGRDKFPPALAEGQRPEA